MNVITIYSLTPMQHEHEHLNLIIFAIHRTVFNRLTHRTMTVHFGIRPFPLVLFKSIHHLHCHLLSPCCGSSGTILLSPFHQRMVRIANGFVHRICCRLGPTLALCFYFSLERVLTYGGVWIRVLPVLCWQALWRSHFTCPVTGSFLESSLTLSSRNRFFPAIFAKREPLDRPSLSRGSTLAVWLILVRKALGDHHCSDR
jgi:hypothetical protein